MNELELLIDLDDTFLESKPTMALILKEATGTWIDPKDWTSYNLGQVYGMDNDEVMSIFAEHNLFERVELAKGAWPLIEFCNQRGIKFHFITSRGFDPEAYEKTARMLAAQAFMLPDTYALTVTEFHKDKSTYVTEEQAARTLAYFDDSYPNWLSMTYAHSFHSLLMRATHNEHQVQWHKDENHPTPLRYVRNLYQVLDVVRHLYAERLVLGEL
jgi:hypothetical protein